MELRAKYGVKRESLCVQFSHESVSGLHISCIGYPESRTWMIGCGDVLVKYDTLAGACSSHWKDVPCASFIGKLKSQS